MTNLSRTVDQGHFRYSPSIASAAPRAAAPPRTTGLQVGANDEAPRQWYEIRNPLWVIVIGMAFLFTTMALIVALG